MTKLRVAFMLLVVATATLLMFYKPAVHAQSGGAQSHGTPVYGAPPPALGTVNRSVHITTGAVFQQVLAATTTGRTNQSLTIQNNNSNGDSCWVYIGATASALSPTSILLTPGASYGRYFPFVPSDAVQATCTSTGDSLYIDVQ